MRSMVERLAMVKRLKKGKESLVDLVGAAADSEVYFLSSFSEALLKTLYEVLMPIAQRTGKNEILVPMVECKETLQVLEAAGRLGLSVKQVAVDRVGVVTAEALAAAISKRSLAYFSSWVNVVSGAVHPIGELCALCKERELFSFVDASDVAGKMYFRLQNIDVDVCSVAMEEGVAVYAKEPLKGSSWGEDFSLEAYFTFTSSAENLLSQMDGMAMQLSQKKVLIEEKYGEKVIFFNRGGRYLFDRWCFAIPGVLSENLAYHLLVNGIEVEYLDVASALTSQGVEKEKAVCAVTMRNISEESREEMLEKWEKILKVQEKISEYSYV
ncbi:aminotransferase class V-fold PLP-dependent enzyme [bacterium]|nr:aminotransferase class V-fold PLP-dependent enzyme [bacterium]